MIGTSVCFTLQVEDLVLFSGIMSDLFLGVERPVIKYGRLMDAMKASCKNLNLQDDQSFLDKIIQVMFLKSVYIDRKVLIRCFQ